MAVEQLSVEQPLEERPLRAAACWSVERPCLLAKKCSLEAVYWFRLGPAFQSRVVLV
ncbi:MAG: hypothetical protein IT327_06245 [Anaerolineae bacterium]|nr:hypothetical protein [Anaerolineae bacterium]